MTICTIFLLNVDTQKTEIWSEKNNKEKNHIIHILIYVYYIKYKLNIYK